MDKVVVTRNAYAKWVNTAPLPDAISYEPSRLGVRTISIIAHAGSVARRRYVRCGDQLLQQLFENDCIMWGHYLGELAVYLTPMGRAVLGEYADKGFLNPDERKSYYQKRYVQESQ